MKKSRLCLSLVFTFSILLALQLLFKIPEVSYFFSTSIITSDMAFGITYAIVLILMFLATLFPIPVVPILAFCNSTYLVASGAEIIDLFSLRALLFYILAAIAIVLGRSGLYLISRTCGAKAIKWIQIDETKYNKWCERLSTKKWKWLYAITGCIPFCPDGYISIAAGVVKFDFWWYTIAGGLSKIVKTFLYLLLMRIPLTASYFNASSDSSWKTVIIYSVITIVLIITGLIFYFIERHRALTDTDIKFEKGKLAGANYILTNIPKDYKISVEDTNKKSALVYAQDSKATVICNAGLFKLSTREPLGQFIVKHQDLTKNELRTDNGAAIGWHECYPLLITDDGNFDAFTSRLCLINEAKSIAEKYNYALCGFGCLIKNGDDMKHYENALRWPNPVKKIRQVVGQYKDNSYFILTCEHANYKELTDFLLSKNVKFAYCLDGGRSTETIVNKYQINKIYIPFRGRKVANVICFTK